MRAAVALAVSCIASGAFAAGQYTDGATSQWFKSLTVRSTNGVDIGCCDQSDCRETRAIFQDGGWWAESRLFPGEWVRVPAANVLKVPNPTMNAVLCEANGGFPDFQQATVPSGKADWVYCFVPAPLGF